ncbi:MAG: chemotaxis protein CheW [Gammaproteobacteria bacterium]|nr:chemotaxis protein CheW [Gammaproteobacteria bacterium]MCW8910370.1 chemotaxis protein CheW [Gammaproteobacteria bacterium]MCW9004834.1 chemotaxis protein CheW [Gammaproteobacteria bacterium]MCW9056743.1 chemotaxis protein CheW [Gammaproteobacteria bacterium]
MNAENDSINHDEDQTQFLSFTLGDEDYGVNILRVQEIRGWEEVREIPKTPDYIKGVLNLRNTVVPIIDLRIRFGFEKVEYIPTTVIIVLSVEKDDGSHVMGVVVDAVSDVLNIDPDNIKDAPNFGAKVNTKFMNGMVMVDERMVILLNVDKLLEQDELAAIENMSS